MTEWDEFDIDNAAIYLHDHGHGDLADHVRGLLADYKQLSDTKIRYLSATPRGETVAMENVAKLNTKLIEILTEWGVKAHEIRQDISSGAPVDMLCDSINRLSSNEYEKRCEAIKAIEEYLNTLDLKVFPREEMGI